MSVRTITIIADEEDINSIEDLIFQTGDIAGIYKNEHSSKEEEDHYNAFIDGIY